MKVHVMDEQIPRIWEVVCQASPLITSSSWLSKHGPPSSPSPSSLVVCGGMLIWEIFPSDHQTVWRHRGLQLWVVCSPSFLGVCVEVLTWEIFPHSPQNRVEITCICHWMWSTCILIFAAVGLQTLKGWKSLFSHKIKSEGMHDPWHRTYLQF